MRLCSSVSPLQGDIALHQMVVCWQLYPFFTSSHTTTLLVYIDTRTKQIIYFCLNVYRYQVFVDVLVLEEVFIITKPWRRKNATPPRSGHSRGYNFSQPQPFTFWNRSPHGRWSPPSWLLSIFLFLGYPRWLWSIETALRVFGFGLSLSGL